MFEFLVMIIPFVVFLAGNMAILYYGMKTDSGGKRVLFFLMPIVFNAVYFLVILQLMIFADSGVLSVIIVVFSFFFGWMSPLLLSVVYVYEFITGRKLGQPKVGNKTVVDTNTEN